MYHICLNRSGVEVLSSIKGEVVQEVIQKQFTKQIREQLFQYLEESSFMLFNYGFIL